MAKHERADLARKGLVDAVKGKAKEVMGAVTGNDSLVTEGQLEQTEAKERREAASIEALADAEAADARRRDEEAKRDGAEERIEAAQHTAVAERIADREQEAQRRAAEDAGAHDAARAQKQIELQAQGEVALAKGKERTTVEAAAKDHVEAIAEHRHAVHDAAEARAAADEMRRRADGITDENDLN